MKKSTQVQSERFLKLNQNTLFSPKTLFTLCLLIFSPTESINVTVVVTALVTWCTQFHKMKDNKISNRNVLQHSHLLPWKYSFQCQEYSFRQFHSNYKENIKHHWHCEHSSELILHGNLDKLATASCLLLHCMFGLELKNQLQFQMI